MPVLASGARGSVIRPILLALYSVNQIVLPEPAAMPYGVDAKVGGRYSVMAPAVVIRPIRWPVYSVNHSAPSAPLAIATGFAPAGSGYRLSFPSVVSRAMLPP